MLVFFRKHRGGFQTTVFGVVFKAGVVMAEIYKLAAGLTAYLFALAIGDKNRKSKSLYRIRNALAWLVGVRQRQGRKPL
jgi:alpha-D-ribose 1-methylphosphonate 5-triphosphate diphosphatase PhnM